MLQSLQLLAGQSCHSNYRPIQSTVEQEKEMTMMRTTMVAHCRHGKGEQAMRTVRVLKAKPTGEEVEDVVAAVVHA